MINVQTAIKVAQGANRNNWLKAAQDRLHFTILNTAETGKREVKVPFEQLIVGAENLCECAEMLMNINNILEESGFEHVVTPNGTLIVSW